MLVILSFLYFFYGSISAAPVSHSLRDTIPPVHNLSTSPCMCPSQQRSLWDILWSCLATIFACTWVSVHPNIPPSGEKWWKTALRRLELMLWALIAPELMILWAIRQWSAARRMAKKYHGHGWTKTHGYFIQMGGFTLFEEGELPKVLLPRKMEELLLAGSIDLPKITEMEIQDRSKGDGLSKALVIGQTTWFLAQCIARHTQGLIITELELVTGAFATLNGIMYFLWWNKPLDIRCSVPVHLFNKPKPEEERFKFELQPSSFTHWPWDAIYYWTSIIYSKLTKLWTSSVAWISKAKDANLKTLVKAVVFVITSPLLAIVAFFSRLEDIANISRDDDELTVAGSILTVSPFYADTTNISNAEDYLVLSVASIIAALFGGLHCAGWFFTFPSYAELIIWRVCSALISIIPLSALFGFIAGFGHDNTESGFKIFFQIILYLPIIILLLGLPIYAIARLILLGEAFAALRYLPQDALAVVDWLSFLPHI